MSDVLDLPKPKQKVAAKVFTDQGYPSRKIEEWLGVDHVTVTRYAKEDTPEELKQFETNIKKDWQQLVEKYLSDEKLAAKHDELLNAKKVVSAKIVGKDANEQTDDFIEVDDYQTQTKALELAYKVKGKTQDKQVNVQVNNVIPILGELKAE